MKAFTLIELLVTVAVIAILASMLAPATIRAYRHARKSILISSTWHNARYTAVLNEDKRSDYYLTNSTWQSNDLQTILSLLDGKLTTPAK